jgi:Flp pilus assembly protein TadG
MNKLLARLAALKDDESGATAVFTGVLMVVALGFVGLGVDVGVGYNAKRVAQNAADSAAYSAGVGKMSGAPNVADQARAIAAQYGLAHGTDGVAVAVNTPPLTGSKAGNGQAVEVVITRPGRRFFSGFFTSGATTIRARAVAVAGTAGDACVLALNPTVAASVLDTGTADVNLNGCSLFSNSSSSSALTMKGGALMSASAIGLVGGYDKSGNSTLIGTDGIRTGQSAMADPYANVKEPTPSGCNANNNPGGNVTYNPTTFCNGLTINAGVTVTLNPGVYFIDRGALTVNGGATLIGNNVTIVLTSSTGSDYATVQINGNADVDVSAPTTGDTAGVAFFQSRKAPSGTVNKFNGGSTQTIKGAIYFPKQTVSYRGGSNTGTPGCTQLLADQIEFTGNSNLAINCAGSGVKTVGSTQTTLVE